jgi:hypothetical protein
MADSSGEILQLKLRKAPLHIARSAFFPAIEGEAHDVGIDIRRPMGHIVATKGTMLWLRQQWYGPVLPRM